MKQMKLKFDSNLNYQTDAVNAVVDLFEGQNAMLQYFTVSGQASFSDTGEIGQGIGNKIDISNDDILENLRNVQIRNRLNPTQSLMSRDFNIEMETGTGKTYVYLKTIFELNKKYGFTKFIIVVPSIAIKEGVNKTIEITKDHFKGIYDNVIYDYFVYDSKKLEQVRNFAVNSNIQIMVINIDAFNKSFTPANFDETKKQNNTNIIHREQDKLSGQKPIDLIAETNPIVIIDEPQSVLGGKGEKAISYLNPLCTLRYSATPPDKKNMVFRLDAVDAAEKDLVKQIEVASFISEGYHNEAYLELISTNFNHSPITARINVDVNVNGTTRRKPVTIKKGDNLEDITKSDKYAGYIVDEINQFDGIEKVIFSPADVVLEKGIYIGDIDDLSLKRAQIRKTIEEHLNKQLEFFKQGKDIKVLSLFFIDKVANYRVYGENNTWSNGVYADIFEEEYKKIIQREEYSTLFNYMDLKTPASEVHGGYFAKDKEGKYEDSELKSNGEVKGGADKVSETFNLIMRAKEELLSFNTPLSFIFSHSALREGWDNPNVFQICTLNETQSTTKKRQEIGRGLRLCVNQNGERIHDKNVNILTVMANGSYGDFARNLQKDIEDETGYKFGTINKTDFAHILWVNKQGKEMPLDNRSTEIFNHFKKMKYIDSKGKILDKLKVALEEGSIDIPEDYESIRKEIVEVVEKPTKNLPIKSATDRRKVKVRKQVLNDPIFERFWNSIKCKTTYSVEYDSEELIKNCVKAFDEKLKVKAPKLLYLKSGITIDASGVHASENGETDVIEFDEEDIALPDIVTFLQNQTDLTRKTIVRILLESNTLDLFKKNPQEYMEKCARLINNEMKNLIKDGIKYTKTGEYFDQELFSNEELFGYLERNMVEANKSVYNYVVYDSKKEREFVESLENNSKVKYYTKLPDWFKIKTPIGNYNPDWAILMNSEDETKMYFVIETKGSINESSLRESEDYKIKCGRKHFEALGNNVTFDVADDYRTFITDIVSD